MVSVISFNTLSIWSINWSTNSKVSSGIFVAKSTSISQYISASKDLTDLKALCEIFVFFLKLTYSIEKTASIMLSFSYFYQSNTWLVLPCTFVSVSFTLNQCFSTGVPRVPSKGSAKFEKEAVPHCSVYFTIT